MSLQAAAQRKFKGKYYGPDKFKGDKKAVAEWQANKKGAKPAAAPGDPTPINPGTITDNKPTVHIAPEMQKKYTGLTKQYKGTYIGKDKYKGIAQKGKHKGKYIGVDVRKGQAKYPDPMPPGSAHYDELKKIIESKANTTS